MGNKEVNEETILGYIEQGWYFRTKVVKGRRYITRRKGQEERGFGPFDPDVWATIDQMREMSDEEPRSIGKGPRPDEGAGESSRVVSDRTRPGEVTESEWSRLDKEISMDRGIQMMMSCVYRDDEGYCSYWDWEDKPNFFGLLDDLIGGEIYKKKRISRDGLIVERWLVRPLHWYCSPCPVYEPRARTT